MNISLSMEYSGVFNPNAKSIDIHWRWVTLFSFALLLLYLVHVSITFTAMQQLRRQSSLMICRGILSISTPVSTPYG